MINSHDILHFIKIGLWDAIHDRITVTGVSTSYLGASLLFNVNFDWSIVVGALGGLAAIASTIKHSIDAYRSWVALKKEKKEALIVDEQLENELLESPENK